MKNTLPKNFQPYIMTWQEKLDFALVLANDRLNRRLVAMKEQALYDMDYLFEKYINT